MTRRRACRRARISHSTFYQWMKQGEEADAPEHFREFVVHVHYCEGSLYERALERIERELEAEDGNFRAALWVAERSEPEKWAKETRIKAEVDVKANVEVDVNVQTKAREMTGEAARASLHRSFDRLRAGGAVNDD